MTRAEIPPADFAVLGGGGEDVVVAIPDDGFDGASVHAWADFVACHSVGPRWRSGGGVVAVSAAAGEVENPELLFRASCR